jgi:hypothetical protein
MTECGKHFETTRRWKIGSISPPWLLEPQNIQRLKKIKGIAHAGSARSSHTIYCFQC